MPDLLDLSAHLCPDCRGLGLEYWRRWYRRCLRCNGSGWRKVETAGDEQERVPEDR